MTTRRYILTLMLLCLLAPLAAAAQSEDVLSRADDEGAHTTEERSRALSILSAAAREARDAGEALKAARYLNRAGRLQSALNTPKEAVASYKEALALLKQAADAQTEVDSLNGAAEAYDLLSECDEVQSFAGRALTLSEQTGYVAGKARALLTISDCQNYGDHALALKTAQEALALWQSTGVRRGVAESYAAIGFYQLTQSNLAEATASQQAALELWRELDVKSEQAEALINLGFIEYRKGAWQNVFSFLTEAQQLLDEKAEPYKMGQITSAMAEAFIESGLPEAGLDKFQDALGYYKQSQNPTAVTHTIFGIGKTQYILGRYEEAIATLQQVVADAEAKNDIQIIAFCTEFLGRTYQAMNEQADALRFFQTAIALYTKNHSPMEAARVRVQMGQVYEQQGKLKRAADYYRRSLNTFRPLGDRVNQSVTLYALGNLELKQGKLSEAETHLGQSIAFTEDMRRVSTSRDLTAAFSATVQDRYERYVECLMRQRRAGAGAELEARAFETSDLARARSLSELLRARQTNLAPGLDPQLAQREAELRQALRAKEDYEVELRGAGQKKAEDSAKLKALVAEIAKLRAEYAQVTEEIRTRYPAYDRMAHPVAWDLRRIQEGVVADDETMLLEYSLGAERSYVWAVTRDRIVSRELPSRAVIDGAAQRVYELLERGPGAETDAKLAQATDQLGRMILSPLAGELNRRRLIVVADGTLNYIPFQLLPSPQEEGEQLVASCEVVNAPSASILGQLQTETALRKAPAKLLAAFGDPVFNSNYAERRQTDGPGELVASAQPEEQASWRHALRDIELKRDSFDPRSIAPLWCARRELANLSKLVGVGESLVAADFDATRERLQSTDLGEYAILHFATHGFLDPARPENSGLMLSTVDRQGQARDGFLGLSDIYNLRAPVDLVVLSACRTALGKEVRGEGLIGLTRGFMYAGASSVVASLWKVDDEATAELMKRFYANLLERGMTPAAALREAQNSIRREPQWRSPYYWAAFTLQGDYRRVIRATPATTGPINGRMMMTGGTLAALLCGAWLLWRRRRYSTVKR